MAVAKLLAGVRPDVAYFGRKDAQQLAITKDLVVAGLNTAVRGVTLLGSDRRIEFTQTDGKVSVKGAPSSSIR